MHADDIGPWVLHLLSFSTRLDPVSFESERFAQPVGTCPYVFRENVRGDHLRMVKRNCRQR
jgi:hypothetical protein